MTALLIGAAILFQIYGGDDTKPFIRALFYAWSLAFGETPADFPESPILEVLYFVMPILGLTVIIEGIIDFALMIRDRKRYERTWCEIMSNSMQDHIIIVGFGRLGFSSYLLLRKLGQKMVIIERDPQNQFLEELRRDGVPFFVGDARREAVLEDANLTDARSVIVATNDDLANLEIALDSKKLRPDIRVVLRMFDQNMADKVGDGFNIKLAMSQSTLSAPAFAMPAIDSSIVHSFVVSDELVVIQKWTVDKGGAIEGKTVSDLMRRYHVGVIECVSCENNTGLFPTPNVVLKAGDRLLVQGAYDSIRELQGS